MEAEATLVFEGGLIVNNGGVDRDTQVKGLGDDNLLYIDAGNDRIGVGIATPDTKLHVWLSSAGSVTATATAGITIERNGQTFLQFLTPNTSAPGLIFGDPESNGVGSFIYNHASDRFQSRMAGADKLYYSAGAFAFQEATTISTTAGDLTLTPASAIRMASQLIVNTAGADIDTVIKGLADDNLLYVDAGNDQIGVGITTPDNKLHVWLASAGVVTAHANTQLTIENSGHAGLQLLGADGSSTFIYFGSPTGTNTGGRIQYVQATNLMGIMVNATDQWYLTDGVLQAQKAMVLSSTSTLSLGSDLTLDENLIILDHAIGTDLKASGFEITGTAGATIAIGDLVYLQDTDNEWLLADASAAATATNMVGIATSAGTDGGSFTILLEGFIRADALYAFATGGVPLYISETAGDLTATAPTTSGAIVRVMGYAHDDADTIYFRPSGTWVEIA